MVPPLTCCDTARSQEKENVYPAGEGAGRDLADGANHLETIESSPEVYTPEQEARSGRARSPSSRRRAGTPPLPPPSHRRGGTPPLPPPGHRRGGTPPLPPGYRRGGTPPLPPPSRPGRTSTVRPGWSLPGRGRGAADCVSKLTEPGIPERRATALLPVNSNLLMTLCN